MRDAHAAHTGTKRQAHRDISGQVAGRMAEAVLGIDSARTGPRLFERSYCMGVHTAVLGHPDIVGEETYSVAVDATQGCVRESLGYSRGALGRGPYCLQSARGKLAHAGRKTRKRLHFLVAAIVRRGAIHMREPGICTGMIG